MAKKVKLGKKDDRIDLGFRPHKHQLAFASNWKQFNELICHRRFGKSVVGLVQETQTLMIIESRNRKKPAKCAYLAPEKQQARDIIWPVAKEFLRPLIDRKIVNVNDSAMEITTHKGGSIKLYGTDKDGFESLRGSYLDAVVLDEADKMPWNKVWLEVVRPTLNDTLGWALIAGTIEGKGNLYNIHERYKDDPRWNIGVFRFEDCWQDCPAYCDWDEDEGIWVPSQQKYDDVINDYADMPNTYQREYQCNWDCEGADQFIPSKLIDAAVRNRVVETAYKGLPVVAGLDASGGGDDPWVLTIRQGSLAHTPEVFTGHDEMQMVDICLNRINTNKIDKLFIDTTGGYGSGVFSRLQQLGYGAVVEGVNFGASAIRKNEFADRRTEMYACCKEWLEDPTSCLPDDRMLVQDLSAQEAKDGGGGRIRLIPKDLIRKKINRSPDRSDSLVLTFARPVRAKNASSMGQQAMTVASTGYSPIARDNYDNRRFGYGILR